ncbi:MAG: hypothetical protein QOI53_2478 [Verrucomicrobiota bacterium]|nr:hypothetical protein [Verrucomicrobiota bacterium]
MERRSAWAIHRHAGRRGVCGDFNRDVGGRVVGKTDTLVININRRPFYGVGSGLEPNQCNTMISSILRVLSVTCLAPP